MMKHQVTTQELQCGGDNKAYIDSISWTIKHASHSWLPSSPPLLLLWLYEAMVNVRTQYWRAKIQTFRLRLALGLRSLTFFFNPPQTSEI